MLGNQLKRLDDNESDFLTHLQQERNKEEQEKKRVEDEQVDAFKRSSSYPCFISFLVGDVLSVGPKVQLGL
jgi:hypothetical protein